MTREEATLQEQRWVPVSERIEAQQARRIYKNE